MKKRIINYFVNFIIKYNPNVIKREMEYAVEGIYITFQKTIIIFLISYFLNLHFELFIILIFFSILRGFGYGLHLNSSSLCLVFSAFVFISCCYLSKSIIMNIYIYLLIWILILFNLFLYSPSDTYKRPLINKKKRIKLKILCILSFLIFSILSIFLNDTIRNLLLFSGIIEVFLIHPFSYKLFKLPYRNYMRYKKGGD